MNIYLLEQDVNGGYDTYDSCVVVAEDEDHARLIVPSYNNEVMKEWKDAGQPWCSWANKPEEVKVTYIGTNPEADEEEIICSSFNAG